MEQTMKDKPSGDCLAHLTFQPDKINECSFCNRIDTILSCELICLRERDKFRFRVLKI